MDQARVCTTVCIRLTWKCLIQLRHCWLQSTAQDFHRARDLLARVVKMRAETNELRARAIGAQGRGDAIFLETAEQFAHVCARMAEGRDAARIPCLVCEGAFEFYISPFSILTSLVESIFPPETTQTTFPLPALPDNAHATEQAPAPSATMRLRSASNLTAAATSPTSATSGPSINCCARSNICGKTPLAPIPSTKDGW